MLFSVNASRECLEDGSWSDVTYYGDCACNSTLQCAASAGDSLDHEESPALEISIVIYLIGQEKHFTTDLSEKIPTVLSPGFHLFLTQIFFKV